MSVDPLSFVPAGTTVDIKITLPRGGGTGGFRWRAPERLPADQVRAAIAKDLVPRFFHAFLPKDD